MNEKELLELGFVDTSYVEEGINYTQHNLYTEKFIIEVSGINLVEIDFKVNGWVTVPNCKTISDLKELIRLFS